MGRSLRAVAFLGIAFSAAAAAAQAAAPPAAYRPLPVGTRLVYDNFACTVTESDGLETVCGLGGGTAGRLELFGLFFNHGTMPQVGYLDAWTRFQELRDDRRVVGLSLPTAARSKLQRLWPLEIGKSIDYSYVLHGQFDRVKAIIADKTFKTTVSVTGTETVEAAGAPQTAFVIQEKGSWRGLQDSYTFRPVRHVFQRTWWYSPALGAIVKARVAWVSGNEYGRSSESHLLQIERPAARPPLVAAAPPAAPPPVEAPPVEAAEPERPTKGLAALPPAPAKPTPPPIAKPEPLPQRAAAGAGAELPPLEPIDAPFVAIGATNVREAPRVTAARVATLAAGERVLVLGRVAGRDWYLVSRDDAQLGYIASSRLVPERQYARTDSPGPTGKAEAEAPQSLTAALADIPFGAYHALVIGNDAYRSLPRLETAVADARAMARVLESLYGFEVTLLTDATREAILGALASLRARLTEQDNLLIYYAGHGVYDEAADRGYWLPVDATRDNPAHWISNADITDVLKALEAKHVLVVADSCYSGTLTRGIRIEFPDASYLRRIVEKKARMVLTSGGLEPVADGGGGGHSVFANALLEALRTNRGALDGQTLFNEIREPIVENAPQTPEYGVVRFAGHDGGDFVFVRR